MILQVLLGQQRSAASSHNKAGKLPGGLGSGTPLSCTHEQQPGVHQLMALPCCRGAGACWELPSPQCAPWVETAPQFPPWGDASPSSDVGNRRAAPGGQLLLFWGVPEVLHASICLTAPRCSFQLPSASRRCDACSRAGKAAAEPHARVKPPLF